MNSRSISKLVGISIASLLSLVAAGCQKAAPHTHHIDATYSVGCTGSIMNGVACSGGSRALAADDGAGGATVSCSIRPDSGDTALDMSAEAPNSNPSQIGFAISNAIFAADGTLANGAGCSFSLFEGANTFSGSCTANAPVACTSANSHSCQPCQLSNFQKATDSATGAPYISVSVLCAGLPPMSDIRNVREVSQANDQTETMPMTFKLYFCDGL